MRIFITGGSGFVGSAFVEAIHARHSLTAMSRSNGSDAQLSRLGATPIRCTLDTIQAAHLEGVDVVVHAAADVREWGTWQEFWRVNVEGTQRMLAAAKEAGVRRFVHIGTEAALLKGQALVGADETYPLALNSPYPYSRTKAHAEVAVRSANDPANHFETIVVRPRFVWGPGDQRLIPALKRMADARQFVWIDGGRHKTSTTYVGNLVYAIETALTRGRGGEAYFVLDDGGPVTLREFLPQLTATAGFELKGREIPGWLARSIAFTTEKAWRVLHLSGQPPVPRFNVNVVSRDCILSDAKARQEMGYSPPFSREAGLEALRAAART
ncbi:NAD(P)-dependent oxidoreductase [Granulicella sp. L60]|uniref:NAD-dependent epimerase/dehydratase family protein n=1 Tax=Granulicella sp. L60 TaxID=1641866 RepID=UPI00131DA709|nr:NAD-dependent epimerase/dehydratase family protein [Granulicella sp. L60]